MQMIATHGPAILALILGSAVALAAMVAQRQQQARVPVRVKRNRR